MGVFNVGLFKGPKYSAFPWSHSNKISLFTGRLTPIAWDFLNTGDKIDHVDVSDVVRQAPMLAPTLDTHRVDIHAFAVRLRSIGHVARDPWSYEDFFNLNVNTTGSKKLPSCLLGQVLAANKFKTGTLFEALGIPTFKSEREAYLDFLRREYSYVFDPVIKAFAVQHGTYYAGALLPSSFRPTDGVVVPYYGTTSGSSIANLAARYEYSLPLAAYSAYDSYDVSYWEYMGAYYGYRFIYGQTGSDTYCYIPFKRTLVSYILEHYPVVLDTLNFDYFYKVDSFGVVGQYSNEFIQNYPDYAVDSLIPYDGVNLLDKVYEVYKKDANSVLLEYVDVLLEDLWSLVNPEATEDNQDEYLEAYGVNADTFGFRLINYVCNSLPDLPTYSVGPQDNFINDRQIPTYPFNAYFKLISDWYINTAISNPDSWFLSKCIDDFSTVLSDGDTLADCLAGLKSANSLFMRFWENDYFTCAFPSPQAGQAVGIPVNGTIVDLRNANAMQKLKERLLYAGSRFRDVLYAITGHKTSAAILEMSEVLASWSNVVNVDSVLQQSETTDKSPQAQYAGTGLGFRSGGKPFSYTAEEPTVIMIVASIVPQASYFQGISRKFLRSNIYDYAIPQLANVGEQKIYRSELYCGLGVNTSVSGFVFGYTRRNGDWMWTPNEVHGDFQGSLDFWHNARIFGSAPSLNESFLQVDAESDNLNRIFAVQSDSVPHWYCRFDFSGQVVRSLPKHVYYDL